MFRSIEIAIFIMVLLTVEREEEATLKLNEKPWIRRISF